MLFTCFEIFEYIIKEKLKYVKKDLLHRYMVFLQIHFTPKILSYQFDDHKVSFKKNFSVQYYAKLIK